MTFKYSDWPSGTRKKLAKGLFLGAGVKRQRPMQPAVRKALKEAYSGQPRKNGAPHTDG